MFPDRSALWKAIENSTSPSAFARALIHLPRDPREGSAAPQNGPLAKPGALCSDAPPAFKPTT